MFAGFCWRSRQFGTSVEVSARHFGTGAELSGHFGTSLMVPKCLGSKVSCVRSVLRPADKPDCWWDISLTTSQMSALVDPVVILSSCQLNVLSANWLSTNWFVSKTSMKQLRLLSTKPNHLKITFMSLSKLILGEDCCTIVAKEQLVWQRRRRVQLWSVYQYSFFTRQ